MGPTQNVSGVSPTAPAANNDNAYPSLRLQCPRCRTDCIGFDCSSCGFEFRRSGGIIQALPPERISRYARFIDDYELIRAAEGRGSEEETFYLNLPYTNASDKNHAQWQIRARTYDYIMARVLAPKLRTSGKRILDLGAGNCWLSFRLAVAGHHPCAVDLLTNRSDGLGAAEHYRRHLPEIFPRFRAELRRLPFQSDQFDAAIFNASFHYAENYEVAMREALRCVKFGGIVVISDTPWYSSEESGRAMVSERHSIFLQRYGTASDSIKSLEFLTNERLRELEKRLSIRWTIHSPQYGLRWTMRPLIAMLRRRREPSRFRVYVVTKEGA